MPAWCPSGPGYTIIVIGRWNHRAKRRRRAEMAITEAADRQTNQDNMNVERLSTRNGQYGRLFLYYLPSPVCGGIGLTRTLTDSSRLRDPSIPNRRPSPGYRSMENFNADHKHPSEGRGTRCGSHNRHRKRGKVKCTMYVLTFDQQRDTYPLLA